MPIETPADRLAYVSEFGVVCNLVRGNQDWDAYGIFDREFVEVRGVESFKPVLIIRLTDLYEPGQLQNDTYRATSVNVAGPTPGYPGGGYDIMAYQHDGTGMVTLILEAQ